eukprot:3241860-Alexandrium_andersonii.AAC.1
MSPQAMRHYITPCSVALASAIKGALRLVLEAQHPGQEAGRVRFEGGGAGGRGGVVGRWSSGVQRTMT